MRVTAAVIRREGRVLIGLRKRKDRFGGLWEFPGGKVDSGEEPAAALRRELREELGLEVRVGNLLCSSRADGPFGPVELMTFEVEVVRGEPQAHEHDELRWVEVGKLGGYEFPELDRPVVRLLRKGCPAGLGRHSRRSKP